MEFRVTFTGTVDIELDDDELEQLAQDKFDAITFPSDVNIDVDSIEEV